MNLLKCPKCGEMFSDSYKECPFCEEDEAYLNTDKKSKGPGRRVEKPKSPSILGPALIVVLVLLVGFLVYTFLGDKIAALFDGTEKPPVVDPVDSDPVTELSVDKKELTLTVGDSAVLTATGAEGYQWSSSDEAVATVDENGTVSAVTAGTATISVATEDASAACVVTVEKKEQTEEPPKQGTSKELKLGLNVNPNPPRRADGTYEFNMGVGDEFALYVDGTDSDVTWASSDPSKVTIGSDGTIKRIASGEVDITATVDGQTIKALVHTD